MKVKLSRGRCAVVVTDVQEVFASPDGPFANTRAGAMIDALNAFLPACRRAGLPVIFSNYVLRSDLADAGLLADLPAVQQGFLSDGSPWVEVDRRLHREAGEIKTAHNRPSAFYGSELDGLLSSLGADTLILCGLSVNNAVSATARDAFARDIPTVVVRDCVGPAPFEPAELLDVYFDVLDTWTAEVAFSQQVVRRLTA